MNAADTSKQLLAQAMKARQTAAASQKQAAKPKLNPNATKKKNDLNSSSASITNETKKEHQQQSSTKPLDSSLLEESTPVRDQYDPMRPNDWEEYLNNGGHKWLKKADPRTLSKIDFYF